MSMTVVANRDLDMAMSMRVSSMTPFPAEISLMDPRLAREYFDWRLGWTFLGVSDHPVVSLLGRSRVDQGVAVGMSRADHLDRVLHYRASIDAPPVRIVPPDEG